MRQNLWPNALAKLCGAALDYGAGSRARDAPYAPVVRRLQCRDLYRHRVSHPPNASERYETVETIITHLPTGKRHSADVFFSAAKDVFRAVFDRLFFSIRRGFRV